MWTRTYFTSNEFRCKCGCGAGENPDDVSAVLLEKLNLMREQLGPIRVTSGARCPAHNRAVGGVPKSAHLCIPGVRPCRAADLAVANSIEKQAVIEMAKSVGIRRIGVAATFVHVDVAEGPDYAQDIVWTYGPRVSPADRDRAPREA